MKPYFDTHSAGVLLLLVIVAWLSMEAIQLARQWQWRTDAIRIGRRSFWLGFGACLIVTNIALYLGPSAFPAAAIRPGAVAFAAGMVIMIAGIVLRGWSFHALGRYFTAVIKVSPDIAWRIHIEETALLSVLGAKYRSYASHHKRLIPLLW
jgi:protein-S-isoprenylcysteine O-methyltransferase Ste14